MATSAPTMSAFTASVPPWIPELAARETAGPSCGRRMAVQRIGRRSSDGWLSSRHGTTSNVSRSKSGW
jgi:hypothetical protein